MKYLITLLFLLFGLMPRHLLAQSSWQPLFNGQNLDGWHQLNGEADFTVEDGEIVGTTVLNTPNSFLATEKEFGDFILELEFKNDGGMNSGIQIRSLSNADYMDGCVHGYEVEIDRAERV